MSLLRVPVAQLALEKLTLEPTASHYVARVHRLEKGDALILFDPVARLEGRATVVALQRKGVVCEVHELKQASLVAEHPCWLLLGLSKADRFEWALREATALGVTHVVPTYCARSDGHLLDASAKRADRWRKIMLEGARQSGRGDVPELLTTRSLEEALGTAPSDATRLFLWEQAVEPAARRLSAADRDVAVVLVVGPEGGLTEDEARAAEAMGFAAVSLGPFVLRAETATIAALGVIQAWRG